MYSTFTYHEFVAFRMQNPILHPWMFTYVCMYIHTCIHIRILLTAPDELSKEVCSCHLQIGQLQEPKQLTINTYVGTQITQLYVLRYNYTYVYNSVVYIRTYVQLSTSRYENFKLNNNHVANFSFLVVCINFHVYKVCACTYLQNIAQKVVTMEEIALVQISVLVFQGGKEVIVEHVSSSIYIMHHKYIHTYVHK